MFTLSMQTNTNVSDDIDDNESCDHNNENILTYTMVKNILSFEQIYDYFENVVIVAPCQDLKPLDFSTSPL
jgi:hypothetical protein